MPDQALLPGLLHIPVHLDSPGVIPFFGVEGVHVIKIQIVCIHQPQRKLQLPAEIPRLLHLVRRQLGGKIYLVPHIVEGLAHDALVIPIGIAPGGVEKIDAQRIGSAKDGDTPVVIAAALLSLAHSGQTHTAKAQAGDHGAVFAESFVLHQDPSLFYYE